MKKTSICYMYIFTMISNIFTLMCGMVGNAFIIIFAKELIGNAGKVLGSIFTIGIIMAFVLLVALSLRTIFVLLRDYKALKNKAYVFIEGKVIGFKKNREPESGVQINDKPIIKSLNTNEEIILNINDKIFIGETYKFNYLKNSKIAEIDTGEGTVS